MSSANFLKYLNIICKEECLKTSVLRWWRRVPGGPLVRPQTRQTRAASSRVERRDARYLLPALPT